MLGERLKRAREAANIRQGEVAKLLNVDQSTVAHWERGRNKPDADQIDRMATMFGAATEWLLFNRGPGPAARLEGHAQASATATGSLTTTPAPETFTIRGEVFRAIAVYDIRAAAGAGAQNHDEEPITWSVFRAEWLRRVTRSPELLSVLRVTGDSMEPTLKDGDTVLVDRGVRTIGRDAIYIVRLGDDIQCKRCSRHPTTGILTIASDNPRYPTYTDIISTCAINDDTSLFIRRRPPAAKRRSDGLRPPTRRQR